MVEVRLVNKVNRFSPNVIAVANVPENPIPTRLYLFEQDLEKTFGSLEEAVKYSVNRLKEIPKVEEIFQIGFVFGNNNSDKDIFVFPFEFSGTKEKNPRSQPYIIKKGMRMCWPIREKLDEFPNLLDDEQISFKYQSLTDHIINFPHLSRLKYTKTLDINNL